MTGIATVDIDGIHARFALACVEGGGGAKPARIVERRGLDRHVLINDFATVAQVDHS